MNIKSPFAISQSNTYSSLSGGKAGFKLNSVFVFRPVGWNEHTKYTQDGRH